MASSPPAIVDTKRRASFAPAVTLRSSAHRPAVQRAVEAHSLRVIAQRLRANREVGGRESDEVAFGVTLS